MPIWRKYSGAPKLPGYTNTSSLTPILAKFLGALPDSEGQIAADELFGRVVNFSGSGECKVETVSKKICSAFCKVTHILDPIRTIQTYYSHETKGERRRLAKTNNPMNQAYIDTLANYLLAQLRERNISPHFCLFYGGFRGIADKYRYNISGEFESYRRYKIFWERRRQGLFDLHFEDDEEGSLAHTPNSSMRSTAFHYSTPRSEASHISLEAGEGGGALAAELLDLESVNSFESASSQESSNSESSGSYDSSYDSGETEPEVFIELKNFPVMLIFQEKMEGVLDDMLEDDGEIVGAERDTKEWEDRWIAWTFQVIAALCAAQGALGFTHNDLHTNNIVWRSTKEEFLTYVCRDGTIMRVPTYGKIMCIIDFGRSIFRLGEEWYISDDYERGGDAEGQYSFDYLQKPGEKTIYPNPSFDLCRYAVSVIDALYPEQPTEKLDGAVLSKEGRWTVHETESPFWNLLWSWTIDDRGRNVLRDEDETERFPNFDLYQHISEHVSSCKPQDQIHKEIFAGFKVPSVPADTKKYPLFC
jgi:hypothetical protein